MRYFILLLLLSTTSCAFQLPFKVPFFKTKEDLDLDSTVNATPRVAIIGAGAGGSSAAFWISKAKERFGVNVEVDVYERESYVGGRESIIYCT
jgi:prenylcysteine oxidase/farnesylcysteine lyase